MIRLRASAPPVYISLLSIHNATSGECDNVDDDDAQQLVANFFIPLLPNPWAVKFKRVSDPSPLSSRLHAVEILFMFVLDGCIIVFGCMYIFLLCFPHKKNRNRTPQEEKEKKKCHEFGSRIFPTRFFVVCSTYAIWR